ncbi:hypothetical protein EMIHUDRAFT_203565 [Emiliania huxleyi CCMP1516]|uniref:Fatty acid desaturase domain-containing protein n=2 Tax=Emiliania huxleyi TaxID=2903 RepID=A0A0D3K2W5_EMIH1|nr:hypothetical protein EMIHUDRAFT_203565 [Emiliania huxleyi CCMP1516]EOD30100.1 hypothetical protein EMIHUDRAFT_203565 [Emiliania huxleyi CCMP1516]|eukprot:XP_005782529.1 hypothetical protein EMIHUDRAFT_203565 [Emiliania huxleyi CCMP1516]
MATRASQQALSRAGTELYLDDLGGKLSAEKLSAEDAWISKCDLDAFAADIKALGKTLAAQQGDADVRHLNKIVCWQRACTALGVATMAMPLCPLPFNPIAVWFLSLGVLTRWTIVAHHVCHGGFDKCDTGGRYHRFTFGVGSVYRRCVDWLDWMLVEAWNVEHNQLHHYSLGEDSDPDLVERNLDNLRQMPALLAPVKYLVIAFLTVTWKWFYYAPNTFKVLSLNRMRREADPRLEKLSTQLQEDPCVPLAAAHAAAAASLVNLVLAELLTNAHAFLVVATNHCGDDLYRFEQHAAPRSPSFYMRQVTSSVNFATGDGRGGHGHAADCVDFLHGWLNYQIEHHLWPDLSMLSYQKARPYPSPAPR